MPTLRQKKKQTEKNSGSGVIPPNLLEESRIPKFYHDAIVLCGSTNSNECPDTALVLKLMNTSQLSPQVLSDIWSLCNRSIPGKLTRQEFFASLALIALEQKGANLCDLCDASILPIPSFRSFTVNTVRQKMDYCLQEEFNSRKSIGIKTSDLDLKIMPITQTPQDVSSTNIHINQCLKSPTSMRTSTSDIHSENDFLDMKLLLQNQTFHSECVYLWRNCLESALNIFTNAVSLLLDSDIELSLEVLQTSRGISFMQCLHAIYVVTERINTSVFCLLIQAEKEELMNLHIVLSAKWIALQKISMRQLPTEADNIAYCNRFCVVCFQSSAENEFITIDGRPYHTKCAIFL